MTILRIGHSHSSSRERRPNAATAAAELAEPVRTARTRAVTTFGGESSTAPARSTAKTSARPAISSIIRAHIDSRGTVSSPGAQPTPTIWPTRGSPEPCISRSCAHRGARHGSPRSTPPRRRAAPGVVAVLTAGRPRAWPRPADHGREPGMLPPFLATDRCPFVGEPVAAVLTEEAYQGEDAAGLVDVEYDPLPAVVDLRDAARDEVLLFPEAGTNTVCAFGHDDEFDADLFDGCEVVVTQEIVNQRVAAAPMETRAARGVWERRRRPHDVAARPRTRRARATGRRAGWAEPSRCGSSPPTSAAGSGRRSAPTPSSRSWPGSRSTSAGRCAGPRPAVENMVGMVQGRAQLQTVTIGGSRDGKVLAYRLDVLQDAGAYPRLGAFLPFFTRMMAPAVYDIPKVESRGRGVVTNTTSDRAYRGAGRPEATAAIERALDLFAAEIGMDPAEVRRRNLVPPAKFTEPHRSAAPRYDSGDYPEALDRVLDGAGYADAARRAGGPPRAGRRRAARHRRLGLRRDHRWRRGQRGRRRRGARRRHGHRAHRHLAARPGPRHRVGDARQRGARHPDRQDHRRARRHRPRPARERHHRLAQPADRRRGRPPGGRASWSRSPSSVPPTCSEASVDDLVVDKAAGRGRRRTGTGVTLAELAAARAARGRDRLRQRARRRSRSARTSPSSRSTPSPARPWSTGSSRSTTPARCSTRCWPRASATAASPRASRRRCSRRSSTTPTATR